MHPVGMRLHWRLWEHSYGMPTIFCGTFSTKRFIPTGCELKVTTDTGRLTSGGSLQQPIILLQNVLPGLFDVFLVDVAQPFEPLAHFGFLRWRKMFGNAGNQG